MDTVVDGVEILEVEQHTSTGSVRERSWEALKRLGILSITGGDSEVIRLISGGFFRFRTVPPTARPGLGLVWFVRGADDRPQIYRTNYDSSD